MNGIKTGDEVRILARSRYHKSPEGGHVGHVIKVGRKYATAKYVVTQTNFRGEEENWDRTIEFDMATGIERGSVTSTTDYVRTPEQVELDRRRSVALTVLKDHNLEIRLGGRRSHSVECLEAVAEALKSFDGDAR